VTERVERTAVDIAAAVQARKVTARTVLDEHLEAIATRDPELNAFRVVRTERAQAEADAIDRRPDLAELPLAGVPVAVKDNVAVAGEAMRRGSTVTSDVPEETDHETVRRLRAAGAVVVGITNVPELCIFATTEGPFGITRSPRALDRTAGGSSGGSAAAVAAGMVPLALGNDGLGSIRIPAANCGLVGIKPGHGVVPAGVNVNDWYSMTENGPLARTVADVALMLAVLADRPELATVEPAGRMRIAVSAKAPMAGLRIDRQFVTATNDVKDILTAAGHTVTDATPRYGAGLPSVTVAHWTAGAALDAEGLDRRRLAPRTRRHVLLGRAAQRLRLVREEPRERWRARAWQFFKDHDVLLTPALARPAPHARNWHKRGWTTNFLANLYAPMAAPWNLAGWPAMVVPVGTHPSGLPTAVQLVAPPGGEARLLALATELERSLALRS
jgi:amidase